MSNKVYKFKTKPTPEQKLALKRAMEQERYGIFFQQRVGKTKVAIDFCGVKHLQKGVNRVLIVCPLSVRGEWFTQIAEHLPNDIRRYVVMYPEGAKKVETLLTATKKTTVLTFIIVNYDKLIGQKERLAWWNPDIIIFDESHLIKHHNSKRSRASAYLTAHKPMVLLLTGTPITKSWTDIFSQFRTMDKDILGRNWTKFRTQYAIMGGYMGKQVVGCSDLNAIKRVIKAHSIRVLRKSVMYEPEVEDVVIPVKFEPAAERRYNELKKTWVTELASGAVVEAELAITRMMRLQQFCGGFATDANGKIEQISKAKAEMLRDLIHTKVEGNEKVVVFHRFKAEAVLIKATLSKYKVGFYNGSVPEEERTKVRKAFQDGQLDVIVVQIATGAMGVSFDTAHINVFYSLDFSLMNYLQAKDRVMGRGQKSDVVTNYYLAIENSIDLKLIKTLRNNEDFASSVTDAYKAVIGGK